MENKALRAGPRTTILFLVTVFALGTLGSGCVPRGTYKQDVDVLAAQLTKEREEFKYKLESLETKLDTRGKSLNELTVRYIQLQRDFKDMQGVVNNLRGDLESLLRDIEELKLVVNTNYRGSEADEMLFMLTDMERRIEAIIEKSGNQPLP